MVEIIPTILVKKFKEVKKRIKQVENLVEWVQLDVADGVFANNRTWPYSTKIFKIKKKLKNLKELKTPVKIEAHLMVQEPEDVIDNWLEVADRIIIHYESKINNKDLAIKNVIDKVHKRNKQIGLAINPPTPYAATLPFIYKLDTVLILTVKPGMGGQEFKNWTLEKIKALREKWPNGNIEVDGGINPKTAKLAIDAGANMICSGTYIFENKNPKKAIDEIKKEIQ